MAGIVCAIEMIIPIFSHNLTVGINLMLEITFPTKIRILPLVVNNWD